MKLLTEDEYREQSNTETRKALEELRRYLEDENMGMAAFRDNVFLDFVKVQAQTLGKQ